MIKRLGHICFRTDQMQKMVEFYKDTLGLKVKFDFKSDKGKVFGYYFELGNMSFLEIFDNKGATEVWGGDHTPLATEGNPHYQHFCLEVNNLEQVVVALQAKSVAVDNIRVGMDHSKQAWLKDPDGNAIELMEYTPQSWQVQ